MQSFPSYRLLSALVAVMIFSLSFVACDDDPSDPSDEVVLTPAVKAVLQAKLDSARKAAGIPGGVVAIRLPNGEEWVTSVGFHTLTSAPTSADTGTPLSTNAQFRIGSITKTFTATVILQLIGEGMLTLDSKVGTLLPDLSLTVVDLDTVTVRQLLNHTSGIQNYTNDAGWSLAYLQNPTRAWEPEELIAVANSLGPADSADYTPFPWMYSNTNYIILGLIMEKLTGKTAKQLITERILDPLDMDDTYFSETAAFTDQYARGYSNFSCSDYINGVPAFPGQGEAFYDITLLHPSQGWTAGAIVATASDLLDYADALADGDLVNAQMQQARFTGMLQAGKDGASGQYGLGIAVIPDNWIGHKGGFNGYDLSMYKKPQTATMVVLTSVGGTSCGADTGGGPTLFKVVTQYLFNESPNVKSMVWG